MNKARYIGFLISIGWTFFLQAQDIHFSQFDAYSHNLNPASIGNHNGSMRLEGIYRNQWSQINGQPLTTTGLGFDRAFHYYSHEIDGGIMLVRDQFSGFNTITNKIQLSAAYAMRKFKSDWRFGFQTGLVTNSTNLSIQTFPNQWAYPKGEFDITLPNGEDNIRGSQTYLDINLGMLWIKRIKKTKITSGLAFNHLNRPKDTYFSQVAQRRKVRGAFHLLVSKPLNEQFILEPKLFWMWTARANDFLLGTNLRFNTDNELFKSFYGGVHYRHGVNRILDAIYPVFGFSINAFDLGFSYDINISTLKTGIKRPGTFECSLSYTFPSNQVKYKIIPCDRY